MNEIREVHHYDETSSSNNVWIAGIAIALLAIFGFAIAIWQPWSTQTHTDTTVIREVQQSAPPSTTIVNPPSTTIINPPRTDVHVTTENKAADPPEKEPGTTGSSDPTPTTTTGG